MTTPRDVEGLPLAVDDADFIEERQTNQKTAQAAVAILRTHPLKYFTLDSRAHKRNLAQAFAREDKPVYGQAYDMVRVVGDGQVDFNSVDDIHAKWRRIVLCEVKATNRAKVDADFSGHFFSLSTAELLVAQKLGPNFEFVFVRVGKGRGDVLPLTLQQVYARAMAIYPAWSVRFGPAPVDACGDIRATGKDDLPGR